MSPDQLTQSFRYQLLARRELALRQLVDVWPALRYEALDESFRTWAILVGRLVVDGHTASTGLAAAYLRAYRAEVGVPGDLVVVQAPPVDPEQLLTALRVTAVAGVKTATAADIGEDQAMNAGFVRSSGAATRIMLDAARTTVMRSVQADPRGVGWSRITSAAACSFCRMLAGRGAIYHEDSVDFRSHDHCSCTAQPRYARN